MRLIDADVLKEQYYQKMKELISSTVTNTLTFDALSLLCGSSLIADAPTIEAEPVKRGKWTYHKINDTSFGYFKCSNCGNNRWIPNYCPNCGAKMEIKND